jgi:Ran GTPase-activating protein (RanGAP) involved in mRNA processing and transport
MSLKNRAGGKPEKVKQFAEPQRKKACATAKTTNEQPPELASDAFPAALGSLPPELWEIFLMNSTWAADRTILLRMTSKRVKELVDKVRPPAVVCWRRSFLEEELNGTAAEKLQLVFRQLAELSARCRITTLELAGHHYEPTGSGRLKQSTDHPCKITGRYAERLAGVLAECPALAHLNLSCNIISISFAFLPRIALSFAFLPRLRSLDLSNNQLGAAGAECLAGVLGQCTALAHLDLSGNIIRAGAESLAGVLGQCAALAHLNLSYNGIEAAGAERLAGALAQCPALAHLNLSDNSKINAGGAERFAGVLAQCTALSRLDLCGNRIGEGGTESLAGVLSQCPALAHLDLMDNYIGFGAESLAGVLTQWPALAYLNLSFCGIGASGAQRLAGVLGQCAALAHLDLRRNGIGDSGAESLAGVLGQCPALAHLSLWGNRIGTVWQGRLRASWRGQASGLVL